MLALINAKRLLNVFGGKHQPAMASIQGFDDVNIGHEPLDCLNLISMGLNNQLLAKMHASDALVDSFKTDVVKEFAEVLRPQFLTAGIPDVAAR